MASNFKKNGTILIPFRDGWSISDSQGKPRIYKTIKAFEKSFPKHYLGTDGVELVEYAEVRHGRVVHHVRQHPYGWLERYTLYECCGYEEDGKRKDNYCPNCGSKMDLEVQDV